MATPKPGEIRCPTCHRSTPPAAFCTQCGSPIPTDARARPRGMDRDELQERIRARRSGGEPYRRGGLVEEGAFERFEPEPEDAQARREERREERRPDHFDDAAAERATPPAPPPAPAERPNLTRDQDDWTAPIPGPAGGTPPARPAEPVGPPPATERPADAAPPYVEPPYAEAAYAEPAPGGEGDDPWAADDRGLGEDYSYDDEGGAYPYEYDAWESRRPRRSGTGAFAIIGFLALGVLALLGGAVLAGVFSGDGDGVGQVSPSPSIAASEAPIESQEPSTAPSEAPQSAEPSILPSGEPIVFPDGFVAEAQPCFPGSASQNGCDSNGATNGGILDIWVGFENGNANDVIGAAIIAPDGTTVGEGSIDLASIGCRASCNGWTFFNFRNLTPGTYEVRVTRNGEPASATSFTVS